MIAFFWVGGVPTKSITDRAATLGITIKLVNHGEAADNLRKKYGPIYIQNQILANAYPGETQATTNIDVWNLLVVPEKSDEKLRNDIVKTLFDKKDALVRVHKIVAVQGFDTQDSGASII